MRKIILTIIVAAVSICANAQVDTAAMRLYLTTHQSKTEMIEKCRDRIFEAIIDNDRAKAEDLMFYARTEFENDRLKALTQGETWLLAIWLKKYQLAATEMVLDSLTIAEYQNRVNHFRYSIYPLLADSLYVNYDFYWQDIENDKSLSESRRDFLLLFIKQYDPKAKGDQTDIMNDTSDEYLSRHPMSEHETFVRNLIRYKFVNTRPTIEWRIISCGAAFYSGDFGKLIDNGFAMDMYLGLSYHNFVLNGDMSLLCGNANDDIDFGNAVMENGRTENMLYGINAGYKIQLPRRFSVTPTVGLGWFILLPDDKNRKKNEDLEHAKIKGAHMQPVVGVEVCYDHKFGVVEVPKHGYQQLVLSPSLRYTFMPVEFDSPTLKTSGSVHTVTIGLKYQFERVKRDL